MRGEEEGGAAGEGRKRRKGREGKGRGRQPGPRSAPTPAPRAGGARGGQRGRNKGRGAAGGGLAPAAPRLFIFLPRPRSVGIARNGSVRSRVEAATQKRRRRCRPLARGRLLRCLSPGCVSSAAGGVLGGALPREPPGNACPPRGGRAGAPGSRAEQCGSVLGAPGGPGALRAGGGRGLQEGPGGSATPGSAPARPLRLWRLGPAPGSEGPYAAMDGCMLCLVLCFTV